MATAISIATLMTAPAFGFMGIGFPRIAMNWFAYAYGGLLPGTWYLTARIDQTVRGTPLELSWRPIAGAGAVRRRAGRPGFHPGTGHSCASRRRLGGAAVAVAGGDHMTLAVFRNELHRSSR